MKALPLPPFWWALLALFLVHQLLQFVGQVSIPLADAYLDPFLSTPLVLGLHATERQLLFGAGPLRPPEIVLISLLLAVIGEEVFPRLEPRFVRDGWDYVAYCSGALLFWKMT